MKLSSVDIIQLNRKPSTGPYNTRVPVGAACSIRKTVLRQCFVAVREQNTGIDSTLTFNCCQYIDQFNVGVIHELLEQ